jgi:hypothetical protein
VCDWFEWRFVTTPFDPLSSRSVDTPPNKQLRYPSHWSISSGTIYYLNGAGWNTWGDHAALWCELGGKTRVETSQALSNVSFPCSLKEGQSNHTELAWLSYAICNYSLALFSWDKLFQQYCYTVTLIFRHKTAKSSTNNHLALPHPMKQRGNTLN